MAWASCHAYSIGCEFVLQLGDLFHIKSPHRNSHELVVAAHEALTRGGLPVIMIAGNHDLMHDRLESIPSQPLGALSKMEGITLLEGWHTGWPVYGIPYLADWTTLPEWFENYHDRAQAHLRDGHTPLVATHAPLFPPGQAPIYDSIEPGEWAALQEIGSVSYGHIHDPHGTYDIFLRQGDSRPVRFANFGAISRGSLHVETLKRKPQVAIYDFVTGEYETVPVPHKPAEEVFRLDVHEAEKKKKESLASFLSGLGSGILEVTTVEKVIDDIDKMDLPEETKAVARGLVEHAYGKLL